MRDDGRRAVRGLDMADVKHQDVMLPHATKCLRDVLRDDVLRDVLRGQCVT